MVSGKLYRVVVDRWTDHSEKSFKLFKGETSMYLAKSESAIGDMPNEFYYSKKVKGFVDKFIEASERKRAA